jgi:hypothetical protein
MIVFSGDFDDPFTGHASHTGTGGSKLTAIDENPVVSHFFDLFQRIESCMARSDYRHINISHSRISFMSTVINLFAWRLL